MRYRLSALALFAALTATQDRGILLSATRRTLTADDPWLALRDAAVYIGVTTDALRKAVERREIPFDQAATGCKIYVRRSDLDAYRAGHRYR